MAYKTTTLKTKTNDNVYPNVIGDNRKNAFVDSSTITHHFYEETHKVGFQINNETNIKIQNSLQKPSGLTKTELVGVGANGQENIEIGDNLTLANGKLSASGGGGEVQRITIDDEPSVTQGTYTGTLTNNTDSVFMSKLGGIARVVNTIGGGLIGYALYMIESDGSFLVNVYELGGDPIGYKMTQCVLPSLDTLQSFQMVEYTHFITMTNSTDNVGIYLTIQNTYETEFTADTLASYLAGKKVLANGNLHGSIPTYIAGEGGSIKVYYMNSGDNNINPDPDVYGDLSSFEISDLVSPVE